MKIAIDASTLSTQGGPRSYLLGLVDALLRIDTEHQYLLIYNDPVHLGRFPAARELVLPGKSPLARLRREHLLLPALCKRERVDLLHCPKSSIPLFSPCPVVVTLHDLIPLDFPQFETFAARCYWRMHIPLAACKSSRIITISEYARRGIMERFGVASDRIDVIMQGIDRSMGQQRNAAEGTLIRSRYGLESGYILYVGTIQPRKNLTTLVAAYAALDPQLRQGRPLVIVGRRGWMTEELDKAIARHRIEQEVIFTGFVPDEELPHLYDGAAVAAYLSHCEGFGRPPLEAMTCGIPVVVSDTGAIPEVVGDAGLTVDHTSNSAVSAALTRILTDHGLAGQLRHKGRERARLFDWDEAALQTIRSYQATARKQ
ncbi:MAG: glycosyltransferase family 4 protein [Geobacteraceae bacterium]|nr:glycosyltransferase family 4 protein [Geobacteraceae bacterium]